jgi:hypothetical protein
MKMQPCIQPSSDVRGWLHADASDSQGSANHGNDHQRLGGNGLA